MKIIISIALLFFIPACVWAQQPGELENVEIEIIKERKITLPEAERKFIKIAPHSSEPIYPPITYNFQPIEVRLPMANLTVRPLKLKKTTKVFSEDSSVPGMEIMLLLI